MSSVANILTYAYDADGNLVSAGGNAGTYTMTYDGNRLLTRTDTTVLTLTYGYDADGNVVSIADSQGGLTISCTMAAAVSKTYQDSSSQLRVNSVSFRQATWSARGACRRGGDGAGGQHVYGYDGGLLVCIVSQDASANLLASSYSYDADGRLASETDNGVTTAYAYDASGQLTQAGSQNFTWDANGNPGTGVVIGPDNQLLSDGVWNYSYDAVGDLISKANIADGTTWTYGYDNTNRRTFPLCRLLRTAPFFGRSAIPMMSSVTAPWVTD